MLPHPNLHAAIADNDIPATRFFLSRDAKLKKRGQYSAPPLITASKLNQVDMVIFFLQQGINPNIQDVLGYTALHHAAKDNHSKIIDVLLRSPQINPNLLNNANESPVETLIRDYRLDISPDRPPKSYKAVRNALQVFFKYNITPNKARLRTIFSEESDFEYDATQESLINPAALFNQAIQYNNPNVHGKEGNTPLHNAMEEIVHHHYTDSLKWLINDPKINFYSTNDFKETPFDFAIMLFSFKRHFDRFTPRPYNPPKYQEITTIISFLIYSGADLPRHSLYYSKNGENQSQSIQILENRHEKNLQSLPVHLAFPHKEEFFNTMQGIVYPMIRTTIEEAYRLKEIKPAQLGHVKDPQVVKQFLLASEDEQIQLLKQIQKLKETLGYFDPAITTRFLFSSAPDRQAFLLKKKRLDFLINHPNENPDYARTMPLIGAILAAPNEVRQIILKYLLPNPKRHFICKEEPVYSPEYDNIIASNRVI